MAVTGIAGTKLPRKQTQSKGMMTESAHVKKMGDMDAHMAQSSKAMPKRPPVMKMTFRMME